MFCEDSAAGGTRRQAIIYAFIRHESGEVETGASPTEIKNTVRLDRAISMLIKTDLPIADISAACGFNSSSAFTAFFKKHTGMTPTKLRS
jgi:transcriptional regulator GlxA family with amidase domain